MVSETRAALTLLLRMHSTNASDWTGDGALPCVCLEASDFTAPRVNAPAVCMRHCCCAAPAKLQHGLLVLTPNEVVC